MIASFYLHNITKCDICQVIMLNIIEYNEMKYFLLTYMSICDIIILQYEILFHGGDNLTAIQEYREKSGMTQQGLADVLGVTQGAVANWENGIRKPDIFMLKKIADALNCTADDLLTPPEPETTHA